MNGVASSLGIWVGISGCTVFDEHSGTCCRNSIYSLKRFSGMRRIRGQPEPDPLQTSPDVRCQKMSNQNTRPMLANWMIACLKHGKRIILTGLVFAGIAGCRVSDRVCDPCAVEDLTPSISSETYLKLDEPCLTDCPMDQVAEFTSPLTLDNLQDVSYLDLSLDECILLSLQNNQVMRDLGGTLLRSPDQLATANDPAIIYNDPRFGEEAALSAFDANLFANLGFENNDRVENNQFIGTAGELRQDFHNYEWGLSKRSATGSQFNFSHITDYDFNNQVGNRFGSPSSSWTNFVEAEVRVPLLQGAGVHFNRIAGPGNPAGVNNGVLVARTSTEISLARFRQGLRELLSNTENAYWDLYYAYRELDTLIEARNQALEIWQQQKAGLGAERTSQDEAQAREQYFRFESQIVDALSGRPIDGTRTNNGSSAGTFRATGGVRLAERRLRLILGFPINQKIDGFDLLKPSDSPTEAPIQYDWDLAVQEAESYRPELLQQRWSIKREELELIAARMNLRPSLDIVGLYRFRGFGKELTGGDTTFNDDPFNSNALADLVSGDRQEWQLEADFSMPIGFRRAHAATRNSELRLARARAIYREQKRDVIFGLSNAFSELKRSFDAQSANLDRYVAAEQLLEASKNKAALEGVNINVLLEAQRRVAESKLEYYRAQIDYMLANKSVHYEKGTMLDWMNVYLNEAQSDSEAYRDANALANARRPILSYVSRNPVISQGPVQPTGVAPEMVPESPPASQPEMLQPVVAPAVQPEPALPPVTGNISG
jgi:outer membrane protein TolC